MIDIPMGLMLQFISLIVIIMVIFSSVKYVQNFIKPTERVAFANAELLRIAIDEVCAGKSSATVDFDFPQPEPFTAWGVLPTLVPGFMLRAQGDPHYLLYYESFPAGEASGWEAFLEVPKRVVLPLPDDIKNNPTAIKNRIDAVSAVLNVSPDNIIFSNIVLGNTTIGDYKLVGDSGSWDDEETFYKVPGYLTLPNANQTAIKYRSCGANALCLKTRDGVYKLDLPHCGNIDYIGLESDYGGFTGIFERTDFYVASPCKAKLKIQIGKCECNDVEAAIVSPFVYLYGDEYESSIEYNVYKYDDTAQTVGKRVNCLHRLGGEHENIGSDTVDNCVLISVEDWEGFCITQDKKMNLVGAVVTAGSAIGLAADVAALVLPFLKGAGPVASGVSGAWKATEKLPGGIRTVTTAGGTITASAEGAVSVTSSTAGAVATGVVPSSIGALLTKAFLASLKAAGLKIVKELELYAAAGTLGGLFYGINVLTEPRPVRDQATFTAAFNSVTIDLSQFKPQVFGARASARAMWLWP